MLSSRLGKFAGVVLGKGSEKTQFYLGGWMGIKSPKLLKEKQCHVFMAYLTFLKAFFS